MCTCICGMMRWWWMWCRMYDLLLFWDCGWYTYILLCFSYRLTNHNLNSSFLSFSLSLSLNDKQTSTIDDSYIYCTREDSYICFPHWVFRSFFVILYFYSSFVSTEAISPLGCINNSSRCFRCLYFSAVAAAAAAADLLMSSLVAIGSGCPKCTLSSSSSSSS